MLDEADVFSQKRDTHDVNRNALVSIFLRQLEYFEGILILTTNRITHCDPAFASRIHISLNYPELDEGAREAVWRNFLAKAKGSQDDVVVDVKDEEVRDLAKFELNGRQVSLVGEKGEKEKKSLLSSTTITYHKDQIKNVVGSARAIAKVMHQKIDFSGINTVLGVLRTGTVNTEADNLI